MKITSVKRYKGSTFEAELDDGRKLYLHADIIADFGITPGMDTDRDTLIIDLASSPGGVDFEAARSLKIDAQRALSLPGKCAPKTAAAVIITVVIVEKNKWRRV